MHRATPSFFRYGTNRIRQQIGMLKNKGFKGLSRGRKVFLLQVDKEPLPHNRQAFNIENHKTIGLKLHFERNTRDESNAQSRRDTLLDGTIVPHLHTYLQRISRLAKSIFQRGTRTRPHFTQEKMF